MLLILIVDDFTILIIINEHDVCKNLQYEVCIHCLAQQLIFNILLLFFVNGGCSVSMLFEQGLKIFKCNF